MAGKRLAIPSRTARPNLATDKGALDELEEYRALATQGGDGLEFLLRHESQ